MSDIPPGARDHSIGSFNGCTMADLVKALNRRGGSIGRPVVDKTGLAGRYFMTIWQTYDSTVPTEDGRGEQMVNLESFQKAVERLLGLKLAEDTANQAYINVTTVARPAADP